MVEFKDVRMVYKNTNAVALDGVSFTISDGEFVFLVGPSGSGKTTVIKLLTGEERISDGALNVNGFDLVAFAMRVVGARKSEINKRVPQVLELVGLAGYEKRRPEELSGGEQQRVAIARALVNNPRMIIADEPTGNLDPVRSLDLMLLLEKINELGTTVLVVTHEKELVNAFSKRVIAIDSGKVISDGMDGYYGYENE